jgi:hypothetical protein
MFNKILIANRGDQSARSAGAAAQLNRMVCEANAGGFATGAQYV